ncbi:DUF6893 family small protein [Streptomyces sp. NPDC006879]
MRTMAWVWAGAAAALAALYAAARTVPDVRRYLRMRRM